MDEYKFQYVISTSMSARIDPEVEGVTIDSIIGCTKGVMNWGVKRLGVKHIGLRLYSNEIISPSILKRLEEEFSENFETEGSRMFEEIEGPFEGPFRTK